jgi:hypothetical protein
MQISGIIKDNSRKKETYDRVMEAQTAEEIQIPERSQAPKGKKKAQLNLYPWRFRNSVQLAYFS